MPSLRGIACLPACLWTSPHPFIATTHSRYMDTVRLLFAYHGHTPFTFLSLAIIHRSFSNRLQHASAILSSRRYQRTTLYSSALFPRLDGVFMAIPYVIRGPHIRIREYSHTTRMPHTFLPIYLLDTSGTEEEN
jgi:hypothetical protein